MSSPPNPRIVRRLAQLVALCSLLPIVFGIIVLAGWTFHIDALLSVPRGQVAIRANTGACFILLGLALWWMRKEEPAVASSFRLVAGVLALTAALVGLVSLLEYLFTWNFGIDQLLFDLAPSVTPEELRPGLMSPLSGLSFLLLGTGLAFLDSKNRSLRWLVEFVPPAVVFTATFGILDYVLDRGTSHTHIAPLTALILWPLAVGIACARTASGTGALLVSSGPAGTLVRRLLPASVVVPILIGWLRWTGVESHFFSNWTGVAITTVSAAALLGGLTNWTALVVERGEQERRRVEEELHESQQRLQGIIGSALDAIITVDEEQRIVLFNPAAEKMFGCESANSLGCSLDQFIPQRYRQNHAAHLRNFSESNVSRRKAGTLGQLWGLRSDGTEFPIEASISGIEVAERKLFTAIVRDITSRLQTEEALREASTRGRFALETAKLGAWELDLTTMQATRSLLHDQIFGYESLLPEWSFDIFLRHVHPDDRDRVRDTFQTCVSQGTRWEFECRIFCPNQELRWIWACGDRYREPSSAAVRLFGIVENITERKRAENMLREREQRIRMLLDSTAEAIFGEDTDGLCTFCNPATVRLLGYRSADDLVGKNVHATIHHTRPNGLPYSIENCEMAQAVRAGLTYHNDDLVFWRRDGTCFPSECWSHPLFDNGKPVGSVITFLDITDRKQAQAEICELNNRLELRVAQRTAELEAVNKELEAFTYSVSHDLRQPLRHISAFSRLLTDQLGAALAPEAHRHLQRIQEGTHRMGLLINDLLNLGRVGRQEMHLQVTGFNSLVDEIIAELAPECEGRQIEWKVDTLPFADCDPGLIRQVFQNLLANALKFTRPRTPAIIEVGKQEGHETPVMFVRDNGVGFSMKYADKLFGVFQRLHRAEEFEGTGIGLATAQRIIRKHGGRIWAEAELDKGATFYFTLGSSQKTDLKAKAAAAGDEK